LMTLLRGLGLIEMDLVSTYMDSKYDVGRGGADNFTWSELERI
jgi:hypothetical protein